VVVDASVLHPAILEPSGAAMRALLAAPTLQAPDLVVLEVTSSLRNRVLRAELSEADAGTALARLRRLPVLRHPLMPLLDRVWELRGNLTPYDAAYVALAERLRLPLLTADRAIAAATGFRCKVRHVPL
jgi:predicted nucleic acid-binding protein